MPYTRLSEHLERFDDFPLILAGPILRATTPKSITVWVALKEAADIAITVYDTAKNTLFSGTTSARKLGTHLYIAAVTAESGNTELKPGQIYMYDLEFSGGLNLTSPKAFNSSGDIKKDLCYGNFALPTFVLAPQSWKALHFFHGSCRKMHGEDLDALPAAHLALSQSAADPNVRPQFLFLTGDQIYADDVADVVLHMLIDVGSTLLGWVEDLSGLGPNDKTDPGARAPVAREKCFLTSEENAAKSHLFRYSEFCAMYLLAWSDVLWPKSADNLPEFTQVFPGRPEKVPGKLWGKNPNPLFVNFTQERDRVKLFYSTLPSVRKVLANISTNMICDDHEITDDWYLNVNWCARVLGSDIGRQVVRNALTAYAVFQAWGNTPAQFDANDTPGYKLLDELAKGKNADAAKLDGCLGLPPKSQIFEPNIYPDPGQKTNLTEKMTKILPKEVTLYHAPQQPGTPSTYLTWNYTLHFEQYQFIILDTRTWRSYPGPTADDPPSLLSDEGFQRQLIDGAKPPPGTTLEITFVISPAVPLPIPIIQSAQESRDPQKILENDVEGWDGQTRAFQLLFSKLASRDLGNTQPPGQLRRRRVVILSGDVHHSYAVRLQYWAHKPYGAQAAETSIVFALLTSSALKNETSKPFTGATRTLHDHGYNIYYSGFNEPTKHNFLAWENADRKALKIGKWYDGNVATSDWVTPSESPVVLCIEVEEARAKIMASAFTPRPIKLKMPTEWRYRLDYLFSSVLETRSLPKTPKIGSGDQKKDYAQTAREHREYTTKRGVGHEIVGVNNLGEITFTFEDTDPRVRIAQNLWWRLASGSDPAPNTTYIVSLEFNDKDYPDPETGLLQP
jgi:hypothetical protein